MIPIVNGLLSLDKPFGVSSYDLIHQVKLLFPQTKIGHSGTLDPLATGLLILGIGEATRALTRLLKLDKHYLATFRLGFATDSDDAEGNVREIIDEVDRLFALDNEKVEELFAEMVGPQLQTPPPFSAKKVRGRRAYELARAGGDVELKASVIEVYGLRLLSLDDVELKDSTIEVDDLRLLDSGEIDRQGEVQGDDLVFRDVNVDEIAGQGEEQGDDLGFRDVNVDETPDQGDEWEEDVFFRDVNVAIHCSSGTYVRSLARDFGLMTGTQAHVARLRRIQIGPYTVKNAERLETFTLNDIVPEREFRKLLTDYSPSRDRR
jgi:tRNA pseudouridine55 synthase